MSEERGGGPVRRFRVIRIDTYGTRYELERGLTRAEAERLVREMEAHRHNQSYHIEDDVADGVVGGQVVYAIIDPAWTGDLLDLAGRHHVWIPDTPGHAQMISRVWAIHADRHRQDRGVTRYRFSGVDEAMASLISTIAEHHAGDLPRWSAIAIVGPLWREGYRALITAQIPDDGWDQRERPDGFTIVRRPTA